MEDSTQSTNNRRLAAILMLALVLRVGVMIAAVVSHDDATAFHKPDTHTYTEGAKQILLHGRFTNENGQPEIHRTPGYPLLLMPGILLGQVELVTIGLQILLSVATVWLVYRTAISLFDSLAVAQLCALLYAIEPLSIIYSCYLLTETLFTFLIVLSVFELVLFLKGNALRSLVIAAFAIAAATYVRPASYFLIPLLAGGLCLRCLVKPHRSARAWGHAITFAAISIGLIGFWQVRNYAQTGYHRFSAISDHAVYYFHGASVAAQLNGKTARQQRDEWGYLDVEKFYEISPELHGAGAAAKYYYMHDEGSRLIKENPLVFAPIYAKGIARTLVGPGSFAALELTGKLPDDYRSKYNKTLAQHGMLASFYEMCRNHPLVFLITALCITILIGYYLLCVTALIHYRSLLNMPMAVVLSVSLYLILVTGGVIGTHRYRTPAMPMVCIVAGFGLATAVRRLTRNQLFTSDQPIVADDLANNAEHHQRAA